MREQLHELLFNHGTAVSAQLLTLAQSSAHGVYPGNCRFLELQLRLLEAVPGAPSGAEATIDQVVPKLALGSVTPGSVVRVRALLVEGRLHVVLDLPAMGYR